MMVNRPSFAAWFELSVLYKSHICLRFFELCLVREQSNIFAVELTIKFEHRRVNLQSVHFEQSLLLMCDVEVAELDIFDQWLSSHDEVFLPPLKHSDYPRMDLKIRVYCFSKSPCLIVN